MSSPVAKAAATCKTILMSTAGRRSLWANQQQPPALTALRSLQLLSDALHTGIQTGNHLLEQVAEHGAQHCTNCAGEAEQ